MSYDVYRGWIVLAGQKDLMGGVPVWARLAPGWVAIAPSSLPNQHFGIIREDLLLAGASVHGRNLIDIERLLDRPHPALLVADPATDISLHDQRHARIGCEASLNPSIYGFAIVDTLHQDFGHRIASA